MAKDLNKNINIARDRENKREMFNTFCYKLLFIFSAMASHIVPCLI